MHILIAYATKTGTTAEAAARLQAQLTLLGAQVTLANLSSPTPHLSDYDAIIVGFPIRMGQMHKLATRFLLSAHDSLMKVPLGLFCCRCGKEDLHALLSQKLGTELFSHAMQVASFGGEIILEKQKGMDRWITKSMMASSMLAKMNPSGIDHQSISAFAAAFLEGKALV
ncbi:MAG: flavodoxin domain-containing protein [Clostridia bacterium]